MPVTPRIDMPRRGRARTDGGAWLCVWVCLLGLVPASCGESVSDGRVRLELWTLALSPWFDDYMHGVIADFEEAHPGVEVVWVDVPYDTIDRKLVTAAAARRTPDVVNFSDRQFARYAALGAVADLTPLTEPGALDVFQPGAMRVLNIGGEQLGVPWYLTTEVQLVNARLIESGGLSLDTLGMDWATLREQARAYHAQTGGFLFSVPLGEDSALLGHMLQDRVVPFRERDGRLVPALTSPEVVAFVEAWVELFRDGVLPRAAATQGHQHLVELYQQGDVAMIQTGANMLNAVRDTNADVFEATEVRAPAVGSLGRSHVAVMVLSAMGQSEHPELAAELALHVTSAVNQTQLAVESGGVLPSTSASLADPFFEAPGERDSAEGRIAYARSLSAGRLSDAVAFTPALAPWPDLRRAFNEGIKRALLEGQDVETTLEQIEREWDVILRAAAPATMDAVPTPEPVSGGAS